MTSPMLGGALCVALLAVGAACGEEDASLTDALIGPPIATVLVQPAEASIAPGDSAFFVATASIASGMQWTSSDTTVARIGAVDLSAGRATLRGQARPGQAAICASATADPALKGCAIVRVTND